MNEIPILVHVLKNLGICVLLEYLFFWHLFTFISFVTEISLLLVSFTGAYCIWRNGGKKQKQKQKNNIIYASFTALYSGDNVGWNDLDSISGVDIYMLWSHLCSQEHKWSNMAVILKRNFSINSTNISKFDLYFVLFKSCMNTLGSFVQATLVSDALCCRAAMVFMVSVKV